MNIEKYNEIKDRTIEKMQQSIINWITEEFDPLVLADILAGKYGNDIEEYNKQIIETMVEEYGYTIEEAEEEVENNF